MDLNLDGKPEWLFKKNSLNEYIITDQDFRHPIRWEPGASLGYDSFSLKLNGQENPTYFVQSGTRGTEISFGINSLWYGQYGIFAGIWLFFYLLILLVSRIQKAKLRQQMVLEEQMNELQYRVITSQFSPHYTFNVLNAISAKLYGAHPELYDYIIRFSRQLRYLYAGKNELSRTLREELEFCRDYLEIQKLRFSGKFDYDIHLSEEVSQEIIIPKMLIFTFVENALKHGLRAMETGGFIAISGAKEDGQIILQVTDNGIGRQAAKEYLKENPSYSTGKGLELLEKLVEQMNRVGKGKITWEMKDGEGERGTMVEITLHI
jgi:two-component sensor histidine kinase